MTHSGFEEVSLRKINTYVFCPQILIEFSLHFYQTCLIESLLERILISIGNVPRCPNKIQLILIKLVARISIDFYQIEIGQLLVFLIRLFGGNPIQSCKKQRITFLSTLRMFDPKCERAAGARLC